MKRDKKNMSLNRRNIKLNFNMEITINKNKYIFNGNNVTIIKTENYKKNVQCIHK